MAESIRTKIINENLTPSQARREYGTMFSKNSIQSLYESLAKPYCHDQVRGIWICGEPSLESLVVEYGNIYVRRDCWFDDYENEETIFMGNVGKEEARKVQRELCQLADWCPARGDIRGRSFVQLRHHKFIVTSLYMPEDIWPNNSMILKKINTRFPMRLRVESEV